MVETSTENYVTVCQHSPLSLYTKLESPRIAKLDFYFPLSQPLDDIHRLTARVRV